MLWQRSSWRPRCYGAPHRSQITGTETPIHSLANPKLFGERQQVRQALECQPANRPEPGTAIVTDKGLVGEETEESSSPARTSA